MAGLVLLSNTLLLPSESASSVLKEMKVFDHQGGDLEVVRDVLQIAKPAQLPPVNPKPAVFTSDWDVGGFPNVRMTIKFFQRANWHGASAP